MYSLVKLRLSIYIPIMITCWGATLAITASATNFKGLLAGRFLVSPHGIFKYSHKLCRMQLGTFEASLTPSLILIMQMWYRRREQGFRIASMLLFSVSSYLLLMLISLVFKFWLGERLRESDCVRSWAH